MAEQASLDASGGADPDADLDETNVQGSRTITVHIEGDADSTDLTVTLLGTTRSDQTPHPILDPALSAGGGPKQTQNLDASSEDKTAVFVAYRGLVTAAARVVNNAGTATTVTVDVQGESD